MVLHSILFFDTGYPKCTVSMKSAWTCLDCFAMPMLVRASHASFGGWTHLWHLRSARVPGNSHALFCVAPWTCTKKNMLTKLARTHILSQSFILFPTEKTHIGNTMLWEAPKWDHMVLQTGHVRLFQLLESVVHAQAEPQAACCQEPGVGDWFSDGWCIWTVSIHSSQTNARSTISTM